MKILKYIILSLFITPFISCNIDEIPNPNGANITEYDVDASTTALQNIVTGIEDLLRQETGFYYDVTSIVGREYYFFTGSDPRYTGEVLGKEESQLDNAGFYGTRPYFGRYRTIKTANLLINAANNSTLITAEQLNGYLGFAKTMQAYELHLAANLQFQNGIRIDVSDPENLGGFVSYDEALVAINRLLDEAKGNLEAAGASFPFSLSAAMAGFDNPASFITFNRGLAARISLYQGDKTAALSKLNESFMDMMGDLNVGPARFYSVAGGDFANNLWRNPDQADGIIAHPSFITDATTDDARLWKIAERPSGSLALDDLSGTHDVVLYQTQNDFVSYIRNEELILISAEASVGSAGNTEAIAAIDIIRNAAGIGAYTGDTDDAAVMDEILYQRRYSLFGEGHRWVDHRRLGRLSELPIDRPDDDVWEQFPRPVSEVE